MKPNVVNNKNIGLNKLNLKHLWKWSDYNTMKKLTEEGIIDEFTDKYFLIKIDNIDINKLLITILLQTNFNNRQIRQSQLYILRDLYNKKMCLPPDIYFKNIENANQWITVSNSRDNINYINHYRNDKGLFQQEYILLYDHMYASTDEKKTYIFRKLTEYIGKNKKNIKMLHICLTYLLETKVSIITLRDNMGNFKFVDKVIY
jgi:hypothetical protein